jgi:hypothetical protein
MQRKRKNEEKNFAKIKIDMGMGNNIFEFVCFIFFLFFFSHLQLAFGKYGWNL